MHDLVIFDCDGVLVDSEPLSNQVMVENLARHGLTLSVKDSVALFLGSTMEGVRDKARSLGADLSDDWVQEVYAEMFVRLRGNVPLMPGVPALLDALEQSGIPYCVASNGPPEKMEITLGQNGLWPRFKDVLFSAHSLGTAKPDPLMFLTAAKRFAATAPVVLEDSASGVKAAMRADMRCLAYAPGHDGTELAKLGAEIFKDMSQVPALLGI